MAWNTPPTFTAGQIVSATDLNNYIRDNSNYLLSGRVFSQSVYVGVADATTTSATFGDVDATNVIVSLTPQSSRAWVFFAFMAISPAATSGSEFDIFSVTASARLGDATHGLVAFTINKAGIVVCQAVASSLTIGASNSFKLQFRSTTAANTTTVSKNGVPITRFAMEI